MTYVGILHKFNPALCESHPIVTPYYCRLGICCVLCLLCAYCIFSVKCVFCVFLQYSDTVGRVFWPVKTVARIIYTVLVETLNHAQSSMNLIFFFYYRLLRQQAACVLMLQGVSHRKGVVVKNCPSLRCATKWSLITSSTINTIIDPCLFVGTRLSFIGTTVFLMQI